MKKNIFLKAFLLLIVLSLLAVPGLSGCKAETAVTVLEEPEIESGETAEDQTEEPEEEMEAAGQQDESPEVPVQIKDITPEEVFEIIEDQKDYFIADVRTKEEYDGGAC